MENTDSRTCATCAHFLQHYIKCNDALRYRSIYCGHCINGKFERRKSLSCTPDFTCSEWKEKPDTKEKTLSEIRRQLAVTAEKIDFIAEILKENSL